jgi:uncharacterized protein (TIGR03086 family)
MNALDHYRRAQDGFESVLMVVPSEKWDAPSMCAEWAIRDVAGHLIWGQRQLRCWALRQEYGNLDGAPGAAHPAVLATSDPLQTYQAARAAGDECLTEQALGQLVRLPGLGEIPLSALIPLLMTDHLAHAWDIGHALGAELCFDQDLIGVSHGWARTHILRAPGFFGPELLPPPEADAQTRWLAYLGRAVCPPALT